MSLYFATIVMTLYLCNVSILVEDFFCCTCMQSYAEPHPIIHGPRKQDETFARSLALVGLCHAGLHAASRNLNLTGPRFKNLPNVMTCCSPLTHIRYCTRMIDTRSTRFH